MKEPEDEAFEELALKQGQWSHTSGWRKKQIQVAQPEPYCYVYKENGEEFFAPKDGYYPADATPLYTHPPQRREQNFCERCGKRTKDIHTCTPPKD
jgi:hypothetical protein